MSSAFYCDLCGEAIKTCPGCKKSGKGKVCTACGTTLITLKTLNDSSVSSTAISPTAQAIASAALSPHQPPASPAYGTAAKESLSKSAVPHLQLLNKNIKVDLKIDDNAIIGRTTGNYIATFGVFNEVSGKHCRFDFNHAKGWCVTDLGSTNKTRYNNQVLVPNTPQPIADQNYLNRYFALLATTLKHDDKSQCRPAAMQYGMRNRSVSSCMADLRLRACTAVKLWQKDLR